MTRRRARGQALVEFAVSVPVFLLLILGLIDFARLLFSYVALADAAREMARAAVISRGSNQAVINAFNNYLVIAGSVNPSTDQVKVTIADASCVTDLRMGNACSPDAVSSVTCSLPLQQTCAIPARSSAGGGYAQVDVTYSFTFNPLFQNSLTSVIDASFMQPVSVLTTSARAYME